MTGMAERKHLREAFKGLSTYIDDVMAIISLEDLRDVTLVGHSFGGMAITAVADQMPDRIKRLVYLDAAVPKDGQSMVTQSIANPPEKNDAIVARYQAMADQWLPPFDLEGLGLGNAPQWVKDRELQCMTDHPILSLIHPVQFRNGGPKAPCTYVVCDNPPMPNSSFVAHYNQIVAGHYGDHWTTRRISTGHMCMLTACDETVAVLAEAALAD
jgi:pimeloyl-ACP methyl ester carboxylesterase